MKIKKSELQKIIKEEVSKYQSFKQLEFTRVKLINELNELGYPVEEDNMQDTQLDEIKIFGQEIDIPGITKKMKDFVIQHKDALIADLQKTNPQGFNMLFNNQQLIPQLEKIGDVTDEISKITAQAAQTSTPQAAPAQEVPQTAIAESLNEIKILGKEIDLRSLAASATSILTNVVGAGLIGKSALTILGPIFAKSAGVMLGSVLSASAGVIMLKILLPIFVLIFLNSIVLPYLKMKISGVQN